jgi:hypothetical protein
MSLTLEQQACNNDTRKHIARVQQLLNKFAIALLKRGEIHDDSKLESPEVEVFTQYTPMLANTVFGSPEGERIKKEMAPCLEHHYANNRHHPQHFKNGVSDMDLVDIIEMYCDWKASSERHNTGNIRKSIEINAEKFNMPKMLIQIFENTVDFIND